MHLPRTRRDADVGRLGMAVGAGVGGVQQAHHRQVQLAGLHRPAEQVVGRGVLVGEEIEGLVERGVDVGVFVAEDPGVIGIGGRALQPVEDQFLQAGRRRRPSRACRLVIDTSSPWRTSPSRSAAGCQAAGPSSVSGVLPALAQAVSYSALALSRICGGVEQVAAGAARGRNRRW